MKIAVVGGGLFGLTAAIFAMRAGHDVAVFERGPRLMQAASAVNQLRLHSGFHYPRSIATAKECQAGLASFLAEYGQAVIEAETIYAIAAEGSYTSPIAYLKFCCDAGLTFNAASGPFNREALSFAVTAREARIDLAKLKELVRERLAGVTVHRNTPATRALRDQYDAIVIAAYAGTNQVAQALGARVEPVQFEVVEKPVLALPKDHQGLSIVVMDGEFCSLDPFGTTGLHLMGHVAHAIHASNVGLEPEIPEYLEGYLDQGIVIHPKGSRVEAFIRAGEKFIPGLAKARIIGSMFTVRAVLPDRDADDARPTLVQRLDEQVVRIFSGKLGTAVTAAERVVEMIAERKQEAA